MRISIKKIISFFKLANDSFRVSFLSVSHRINTYKTAVGKEKYRIQINILIMCVKEKTLVCSFQLCRIQIK